MTGQRLDQLSRGLAKEAWLFRIGAGNDPMLYLERKAYREAIADALAGIEKARVTLAKVIQRLETSPGQQRPGPGQGTGGGVGR